ncbi:kinase-like protein [Rhizophagus clarus]|uniref:Kinase-like protein n=1 Tax=Rhizophagus clarus TaxID=94130 RepID=A0A8H3M9S7_9GLOM|nr:kinase-like protein [Rhizophagus clarus]
MMFKRSTSTPIRPVAPVIEEPITKYQQPLRPGPLSSPSILPFNIGSTIVNPVDGSAYHLIQPLGNGSYAVVYMAQEKNTGKFFALKCLSKANLSDYHLEIQHNEVRIHERLSHPNIVKLDHYFETPDWLFLVLEYCEGQDLYYWLTQNNDGKDPITDAVGYCHRNGVAHRDLKPENFIVMIKNDSEFKGIQVKLTDFGLATDEKESVDFDCGSKPYMSYECRNSINGTYNPRLADIWSLGIILLNLLYHRSPWADPNPEECKAFTLFQLDKTGFLMEKFLTMPKNIAQFFASRVFCNAEKGRISIKEWRNWFDKFVERMSDEEIELDDVFDDMSQEFTRSLSSISNARQHGHDRQQSWSDVVGEFESEVNCNTSMTNDRCSSKRSSQNTNAVEANVKLNKKDRDDENQAESANNSDADSGFGTDEEVNNNIVKRLKEQGGMMNENSNSIKALSVSPPKIIYCKPKPWGDYRSRGHQRENSIEGGSTISNVTNNNHWSSYNQRRERLEQRRKEKQEQTLNSLGAYRRRGSLSTDANDTFTPSQPSTDNVTPRRKPHRPSNLGQDSIYTVPPRRNVQLPRSPPRKKSLQSMNDHPFTPPTSSNSTEAIVSSNTSKQRPLRSYDKTPKKVGKSTKNHLGKMLAGVVMFNRGVKVGGQVIDENL